MMLLKLKLWVPEMGSALLHPLPTFYAYVPRLEELLCASHADCIDTEKPLVNLPLEVKV